MARLGWLAAAFLALGLPACGGGSTSDPGLFYASLTPQEPTAGTWQTWILASGDALRPVAPPSPGSQQTSDELDALRARALARGPTQTTNITTWNVGTCKAWNELQRALIISRKPAPPAAARGFALVSVAMSDAMVAAFDAKYHWVRARPSAFPNPPAVFGTQQDSPSYVSERAAISAAAAAVLKVLFPLDVAQIDTLLQSAKDADLDACVHFPSDVDAGAALGDAVATQVLAYKTTDHGDDAQPTYTASGIAGRWQPTPPALVATPVLPGWGSVKTWLVPSGSSLRPAAPPAYNSNEWKSQRDEVLNVTLTLTTERKNIATFWADGGGTVTPPGHWNQIAVDTAVLEGFTEPRMARMLAYLGVAQHDAFVCCWECKFFYDIERPISVIRRDVAGQGGFLSFIATPPFPSYPSGHSSTSGAASQLLGYFLPSHAISLASMASEARDSRLFGGIHFSFDNDVGFDLGRTIGTLAIEAAATDGAP